MTASHALCLVAVSALCVGAVTDVKSRQAPNWIAALVLVCGGTARWLSGDLTLSVLAALFVFAFLFVGWRFGALGGADVKLISASTLLVPVQSVPGLLFAIVLSGGVLALAYLLGRHVPVRAARRPMRSAFARLYRVERWRMRRSAPLPYVCAIAAGSLFSLVTG